MHKGTRCFIIVSAIQYGIHIDFLLSGECIKTPIYLPANFTPGLNFLEIPLSPQHNCSKVKAFLNYRLGQYITNVTRAAEVCSEFLCQSNGRCVRRDPQAPHYLHLSRGSYRILSNRNGTFTVTGWHSQHELQLLADRFHCHCYQGYEGDRCDSIEPEETEEDNMIKEDLDEENKNEPEEVHKDIRDTAVPLQNAFILTALLLLLNFSYV